MTEIILYRNKCAYCWCLYLVCKKTPAFFEVDLLELLRTYGLFLPGTGGLNC